MKKLLAASAALALGTSAALAQSSRTDTFEVRSFVEEECSVSVGGNGANITYKLDQEVGFMTVECNVQSSDIEVSFSSSTGGAGALTSPDSSQSVPYNLDVRPRNPEGDDPTVADNRELPFAINLNNDNGRFLNPKEFIIRLNVVSVDAGGMFAGTYNDTITVNIDAS